MDTRTDSTPPLARDRSIASLVLRGGTVLLAGHAGARALSLVRLMILARILGPEQFGLASLLVICVLMLEMVSGLSFDKALIRSGDRESRDLLGAAHALSFGRGVILASILFLGADVLASVVGASDAAPLLRWLALAPLFVGLTHLEPKRVQREMRYAPDVGVEVVSQLIVTLAAWPIALALGDATAVVWLLIGRASLQMVGSHLVARTPYRWSLDTRGAVHLITFGAPLILNGILLFAILQGDQLIVGREYGLASLGVYAAVYGLLAAPVLLIGKISISLLLPVYSSAKDRHGAFERTHRFASHGLGVLAVLLAGGAFAAGDEIVRALYGTGFSPGVWLVGAIGAMQGVRLLRVAPSVVSLAIGNTTNVLYANLTRALALPAALAVALAGGDVALVAMCGVIGEILALAVMMRLLGRQRALCPSLDTRVFAMVGLSVGTVVALSLMSRMLFEGTTPASLSAAALALVVGALVLMWRDLRPYMLAACVRIVPGRPRAARVSTAEVPA